MEANPANPANPTRTVANQENSGDHLLVEIVKMNIALNKVASDGSIIRSDTTELKNTLQTRLDEAEGRIANVEDSNASMANESGATVESC